MPAPRSSTAQLLNLLLLILLAAAGLGLLGLGAGLYAYSQVAQALPPPQELRDRANTFKTTQILDRSGALLYEVFPNDAGRRTVVPLGSISPYLINATLATEDPNFYRHPGVDPVGVARAVYYILRQDARTPGGSSITQQLVKLTFLDADKSFSRKLKEAVLAVEISRRYDKDAILEIYLNHIFYGNLAYGVEAAAQTYFGKTASTLDLAEASLLAGIPQLPAVYDPYANWEAARGRQADVLRLMVEHGFITPEEATTAWRRWEGKAAADVLATPRTTFPAPHFVVWIRQWLDRQYGPEVVAKGGLRVTTTLDPTIQRKAEEAVQAGAAALRERNAGAKNVALVALDVNTGEVLAMVGSPDYTNAAIDGQVNMAVTPRQTGSAIKPLTYLATFERGPDYWTPATVVLDEATEFPDGAGRPPYVPRNYDGKFHGPVSVRAALANSYNIPAVKALQHVGIPALRDVATRLGISTLDRPDYGLSLTLGGGEVSLLEMTAAFSAFAGGGYQADPHGILRVQTETGGLLEDNSQPVRRQVMRPEHAFLISSILSDTEARRPAFGASARWLELPGRQVAAKTGTTNDYRDGWTVGYTPELAAGVWVGNAGNEPMNAAAAAVSAAPIWNQFMQAALSGHPATLFPRPQGIVEMEICTETGRQATSDCPNRRAEVFAADQLPPAP